MINSVKARTPILVLILFVFAVGYTFAANKVVIIPMAGDSTDPAIIQALNERITELENAQTFAVYAGGEQDIDTPLSGSIRSLTLTAPTDGIVIINSTVNGYAKNQYDGILCSISSSSTNLDGSYTQNWGTSGTGNRAYGQLAGTRGFIVTEGDTYTYHLVCNFSGLISDPPQVRDSSLTAIFTPSA